MIATRRVSERVGNHNGWRQSRLRQRPHLVTFLLASAVALVVEGDRAELSALLHLLALLHAGHLEGGVNGGPDGHHQDAERQQRHQQKRRPRHGTRSPKRVSRSRKSFAKVSQSFGSPLAFFSKLSARLSSRLAQTER